MNDYRPGNASLFASMARTDAPSVVYVLHADHQRGGWNVFKKMGLAEDYVTHFDDLSLAQNYCNTMNQVGE